MNYEILKTELALPAYNGMTTVQKVQSLNNATIAVKQPIQTYLIKQYLIMAGVWRGIADGTSATSKTAVDVLDGFTQIDVTDPAKEAVLISVLDALVAEVTVPDFVEAHKTAILSMGDTTISRATELGLPEVTIRHIQEVS